MINNEEPIYGFGKLKEFLIKRGYVIGSREPYTIVKPEEVTPDSFKKGNIRFDANGIFVKLEDGREMQVFLYKRDYHISWYGKPRFHICKCNVIQQFIDSGGFREHYMRTNSDPVEVIDLDDCRNKKFVEALPLCTYCRKIIFQYGDVNSSQFAEILKSVRGEEDEEVETDLFGYTRDWEEISKKYKENKNYTCENCGLKIDDEYDRQYIHCHHIDRIKTNNIESNLKCLCLYCHAHVDDHHKKRLTTGANRFLYEDFIRKYGNRKKGLDSERGAHLSYDDLPF